ncbi:sensor histidine kinase [Halalkalibacter sp. AB-rgal2]|uniref:sensor histidine kinase n=1 Tax=Halalkalibacter sp. AB-rgal2 TaxID=3242695 RepID=UPI00359ED661
MFLQYVLERRSWVVLIVSLQLIHLFIAYVDTALPFSSSLYIVFLSTMVFLLFLIIRYRKEAAFFKQIVTLSDELDLSQLKKPSSPFESIIDDALKEQERMYKQQLHEHQKMLDDEKDHLLSWIHEMKTPLTAMHLIIDRVGEQTLKRQLSYEWLRIHLLLDQQLHHKRFISIENDLYIEEIQLEELIHQEIKALKSWCFQKGIGFDLNLEVATLLSDSKWLSFMIRQLLSNAIKYSERTDISIKSYMENGHCQLEIADDGCGISAKDLPRVFDKGFTSTTTHHEHAATGMGLYLTKKVSDSLHIQLSIHSKLGAGTTCHLLFPKKNQLVHLMGM